MLTAHITVGRGVHGDYGKYKVSTLKAHLPFGHVYSYVLVIHRYLEFLYKTVFPSSHL